MDHDQEVDDSVQSLSDLFTDDQVLKRVRLERSRTKNWIARILVCSLVASFPIVGIMCWLMPDEAETAVSIFDRWLTVVASLTGAAIGVGTLDRR